CYPRKPSVAVQIPHDRQWGNLAGSRNHRRTKTPTVFNRNTETVHQGTRIPAKALLAGNQGIAVMGVFHLTLGQVGRGTHIVMWSDNEAAPFAGEKLSDRLNLLLVRLLFRNHV